MIRVALLGLGRIGAQADADPGYSGPALSHLGALLATPEFDIVALVDPLPAARDAVAQRWPHLANRLHENLNAAKLREVAVVVVAGTTAGRVADLQAALVLKPRLVIAEKPFALDAVTAEALAAAYRDAGVELRVNFPRALSPAYARLRRTLGDNGRWRMALWYSHGLHHFGSHGIDLMLDWCGPVAEVQSFAAAGDQDPLVDAQLTFQSGDRATLHGVSLGECAVFEMEVWTAEARVLINAGGAVSQQQTPERGRYYPGYVQLGPATDLAAPAPIGGFADLYAAARAFVATGRPMPGCTPERAVAGLRVQDAMLRSMTQGKIIRL